MDLRGFVMDKISQEMVAKLFENLDNTSLCYELIKQFPPDALGEDGINSPSLVALTNKVELIDFARTKLGFRFDLTDEFGYTALHLVAKFDHLDACKYILENNLVDINMATLSGYTPLMLAASIAKLPLIQLLLTMGANPNLVSNSGKDIFYYAKNNPSIDVEQFLLTLEK
jgi:ankyrin repeat protein